MLYLGCSNFDGWQVADASWTSSTAGLASFVSVQNEYSLLDRSVEDEVTPACERFGLGILPFFPLARGLLTGKYQRGAARPPGSRAALEADRAGWLAEADWDRVEALAAFAKERDVELLDVAIGGLAAQPAVTSVIAGATHGGAGGPQCKGRPMAAHRRDVALLDEHLAAEATALDASVCRFAWSSDPDGQVGDVAVGGVPGDRRELVDPAVVAEHVVGGQRGLGHVARRSARSHSWRRPPCRLPPGGRSVTS